MTTARVCQTPFGEFRLHRYPTRRHETLRAWCAADQLLLEEIARNGAPTADTLVVNDEHGALCVALQPGSLWTDSALAALALRQNLTANQRQDVPVVWSTDLPPSKPGRVVLRIPKQLPYLEYQLGILSKIMKAGSQLLAAGMDKHLSPRVADLLERYIGPTQRHRGQRKARLFSAIRDQRVCEATTALSSYYCDPLEGELLAQPNVFSHDRLDGGSRLLVAQLQRLPRASTLVDLACGNGVLGLVAFNLGLAQTVVFADESAMAIASAGANASRLFPEHSSAFTLHRGDGLASYSGLKVELILCNPPFHLNHTVDEYAGRRLLQQCADHLLPGGHLCMVANRHLDYLPTLRRHFQNVHTFAQDRRFNVWLAQSK